MLSRLVARRATPRVLAVSLTAARATLFTTSTTARAALFTASTAGGRPFLFRALGGAATLAVVGFTLTQCTDPVDCDAQGSPAAAQAALAPPVLTRELARKCAYEALGTGIIVLLGCGGVAASKYLASGMNLGGASLMWGLSVSLAVYATRDVSGAHLNPAVTAALAFHKPEAFAPSLAPWYMASQVAGGAAAGALNYALFARAIRSFEAKEGLTRGAPGSAASFSGAFGMVPNPAAIRGPAAALLAEVLATSVLTYMVFNLTDEASSVPPDAAPVLIGSTVAVLVSVFGPLTGAGMNPARDLGPRLVTGLAGWRGAALAGAPIYTVGPVLGGLLGGAVHGFLRPAGGQQ